MKHAVGIDIGKTLIAVCHAQGDDTNAQTWPVTMIDLTDPTWWAILETHLPEGSTVALEPTGWHLSRPIVAIAVRRSCTIVSVNHNAAAATRQDRVTPQKTDANDARALALKARDFMLGRHTNGCTIQRPELEDLNIALRLRLAERKRVVTNRTRAKNRLSALAHSAWPCLSQRITTYARCILAGAITPHEVKALVRQERLTGKLKHFEHHAALAGLIRLDKEIPDSCPPCPDPIREAIRRAFEDVFNQDNDEVRISNQLVAIIEAPELLAVTNAWRTVPFASDTTIATLHAACRCEPQLLDADQFKAAVGCHPSRNESGQVTEARDVKRGFKPAKAALHIWTIGLLNPSTPPNPVKDYFDKLKATGHQNAIHAARGKLARILQGIARSQTDYHYTPKESEP